MSGTDLKYRVGTLKAAGLDAKWSKNSGGAPIMLARKRGSTGPFYYVDKHLWGRAKVVGLTQAFDEFGALGLLWISD